MQLMLVLRMMLLLKVLQKTSITDNEHSVLIGAR
jgi:hypothetical protein